MPAVFASAISLALVSRDVTSIALLHASLSTVAPDQQQCLMLTGFLCSQQPHLLMKLLSEVHLLWHRLLPADPQIDLDNTEDGYGHLSYKAKASGGVEDQLYELDLVLYKAVDKDSSKISISPRNIFLMIEKKEAETWPRLTKDSGRHLTHIKVDWE